MDPWIWAVLLLAIGMALSIMEIFFPSGGLFGFLCVATIVGSIVMAFRQGPYTGMAVLCTAIVGLPCMVALALKYWPKTPMGRAMLLTTPEPGDLLPDSPRLRYLKGLIGRVGQAQSKMLPSGAVRIDGKTIDAVSEGVAIEPGTHVRVIEVRANRVVVRPVDDETPTLGESNPLARPIDSIVPDPFDKPPTTPS